MVSAAENYPRLFASAVFLVSDRRRAFKVRLVFFVMEFQSAGASPKRK
jgi:hypothetical protein